METIVNAHRIRIISQPRSPVRPDGQTLEEGAEEDGDGVGGVDEHEGPDDEPDGAVVAAEAEEEDEDGRFDESEDGVVAELLEEVPPQAGGRVQVFWHLVVFPAVVVELKDCA